MSGTNLVDGEHVEVCDVVLLGILDPGPALLLINQLSNVLVYKFTLQEITACQTGNNKKAALRYDTASPTYWLNTTITTTRSQTSWFFS